MIGPRPDAAPTIVMLHEGLGWSGCGARFRNRLAAATGAGVFIYSRAGYGKSSPGNCRARSFMHEEATDVLPRVLDAIGFQRGFLFGHSDGASIAAIYAGSVQDHRVRGLVLIAPHFFTEDIGLAEIERARARSPPAACGKTQALARRRRLRFRSWSEPWLDPEFRKWDITDALGYIRVPMLICRARTTSTARSCRSKRRKRNASPGRGGDPAGHPPRPCREAPERRSTRSRIYRPAVPRPSRGRRSRPVGVAAS